jgi:hypothetical protein
MKFWECLLNAGPVLTRIKEGTRSFAKYLFSRQIFLLYFEKGIFGGNFFKFFFARKAIRF